MAAAIKIAKAAKDKAWKDFLKTFPNTDKNKFTTTVQITGQNTATAEIYFKAPDRWWSVFGSDSKYWSQELRIALGQQESSAAFPPQLMPIGLKGSSLPIPAVSFGSTAPSLKKIFNNSTEIYATPDHYFTMKFREINKKNQTDTPFRERVKKMAGRPPHELLAATANLWGLVHDNWLQNFA